ncbi:UDP-3-O-acyl-N-acetylglucosamine deacetylase [Alphaproteobacteria bacterium]|nr:UDP-3-O-acyl-N-acetylglucosamine deacetylase [Alphaproteobacteria bacterium]
MPDSLNIPNISFQKTLNAKVFCQGIGLHSGLKIKMEILPAEPNHGIVFIRKDISENQKIFASYRNVSDTKLGTTIKNSAGYKVCTIEHLMAAFMGLKIDNALVLLSGSEVPIMDGSSKIFVDLINNIGIKEQFVQKRLIKIMKEVSVGIGRSSIIAQPSNNFSIDYKIDFEDPAIGVQNQKITNLGSDFDKEISSARTFGMLHEVQYMHENGLALGGSMDNAIVVDNGKVLNPEGLRFKDEFVRHKILDLCGDIYLCGKHLIGSISAVCAGHEINNKFLWELFSDKDNYQVIESTKMISMEEVTSAVA